MGGVVVQDVKPKRDLAEADDPVGDVGMQDDGIRVQATVGGRGERSGPGAVEGAAANAEHLTAAAGSDHEDGVLELPPIGYETERVIHKPESRGRADEQCRQLRQQAVGTAVLLARPSQAFAHFTHILC